MNDIIDLLKMHRMLLFDPRPQKTIDDAIIEIQKLRIKVETLQNIIGIANDAMEELKKR